jgi:hypothetical protein
MATQLKQTNRACGYIVDGGVLCDKRAPCGKTNPHCYCQKHFHKRQRAREQISTHQNHGSAPQVFNVDENEPVDTNGDNNGIVVNGSIRIE